MFLQFLLFQCACLLHLLLMGSQKVKPFMMKGAYLNKTERYNKPIMPQMIFLVSSEKVNTHSDLLAKLNRSLCAS